MSTTENTGKQRATDSLQQILDENTGDLALGDFIGKLGARAFGITLLFLSLATLLIAGAPGFSTVLGLPIVLLSLQMAAGRKEFWLPKRLAEAKLSHEKLEGMIAKSQAILKKIEWLVKPRLPGLVRDEGSGWQRALGAYCALLGIVLALPILFGNFLPALAIALIAMGLIEEDGGAVAAGIGTGLLSIAYAVAFFVLGTAAIERIFGL